MNQRQAVLKDVTSYVRRGLFWLLVIAIALYTMAPFYYAISISFRTNAQVLVEARYVPEQLSLVNFQNLFTDDAFMRTLFNSSVVSTVSVIFALVVGSFAAYALGRVQFKGRMVIMYLVLAMTMFPQISILSGLFAIVNDLDIYYVKDASGKTCGSSQSWDDTVEYVTIQAGYTPGTWTVRVIAFSLPSSPQYFGLAAHPILVASNLSISASAPTSVAPGDYFHYHQYVSNSGYTAGGSYVRLYVPDGFTVLGVRIYTEDGHSHWYNASQIYHPSGSNFWRVAVGETLAYYPRHVRWYIRANPDISGGTYSFWNNAYWREGGNLYGTDTGYTYITVPKIYLPLILKNY